MNNAASSRAATQAAQKENAKAKVSELLERANRAIQAAVKNGQYQATANVAGGSPTEVTLVIGALRKLGYIAKLSSTPSILDIGW